MRGQIEAGVNGTKCASRGLAGHHDRDIALRGTLGNGADVDRSGAKCFEHRRCDTRIAGHAIAHHRENRQVGIHFDRLDLAARQLAVEGRAHHAHGTL